MNLEEKTPILFWIEQLWAKGKLVQGKKCPEKTFIKSKVASYFAYARNKFLVVIGFRQKTI